MDKKAVEAYAALLRKIREHRPDTPILALYPNDCSVMCSAGRPERTRHYQRMVCRGGSAEARAVPADSGRSPQ